MSAHDAAGSRTGPAARPREQGPPAYLIYTCHEFRDKPGHVAYCEGVQDTLAGTGAQVLVAYTPFEVLEGDKEVKGVVVIKFPTYAAAKDWYDSDAYMAVRGRRIRNSYTGILVEEGFTPVAERFPEVE